MLKKIALSVLAVFITRSILGFIVHGLLLRSVYEATAYLWRPVEEMSMGVMYIDGIFLVTLFVCIYAFLIRPKSPAQGLKYGILFGLFSGISMGDFYSIMPIPFSMAFIWFFSSVIEFTIGGLIVGSMIKETME